MRINNNLMAMNTHRQLTLNTTGGAKSIEKLSSGYRINRAGDDAAGLAISEKMRGQIRGLTQASRNAQDDISLIQTTEGALNETHAIIQRMREMAVQSANDTNTDADRQSLQNEMNQLAQEVTRISNSTEFNTRKLLNGNLDAANANATGDLTFHIGANTHQNMKFSVRAMDAASLGLADTELSGSVTLTKDIEGVNVDKNAAGANVKDGTRILISADTFAAGTDASATVNGVAFKAKGPNAEALNGYTITVDSKTGNTAGMVVNHDKKTIMITTNGTDVHNIDAAKTRIIGTKPEGITSFEVTGQATTADKVTGGTVANGENGKYTVHFNDGKGNDVTVANVKVGTKEVAATGVFEGVSIKLDNYFDAQLNGVVELGKSTATTFGAGGVVDQEAKVSKGIDITTQSAANTAITTIDAALKIVSDQRAELGAVQNRLEHTIKNVDTSAENLQASESRIRDVDMAKEMMQFTKNNILQQAAQAMLAQANQAPQGVLQLLR